MQYKVQTIDIVRIESHYAVAGTDLLLLGLNPTMQDIYGFGQFSISPLDVSVRELCVHITIQSSGIYVFLINHIYYFIHLICIPMFVWFYACLTCIESIGGIPMYLYISLTHVFVPQPRILSQDVEVARLLTSAVGSLYSSTLCQINSSSYSVNSSGGYWMNSSRYWVIYSSFR